MIRNWRLCGIILLGAALCLAPGAAAWGAATYETSFEQEQDGKPEGWATHKWSGDTATFEYAEVGRTGKRSVMVSSETGVDWSWYIEVPVKPNATYRLSGWIKTENVQRKGNGRGAQLNVHNIQSARTPAVSGTKDWTRVETVFETGGEAELWINCLFGGWGMATGKAWFDDIKLEELAEMVYEPTATIDAAKTGEPLSKYVYAQFIEHLGRCIYGGIWAEMLEDRKFYYAVGAKESPWKALGGAKVEMSELNPLSGKWSPALKLAQAGSPGGIVQQGLGLRKEREYVGYVILAADESALPIEVTLAWGGGPKQRVTQKITKLGEHRARIAFPKPFRVGGDTDNGSLSIASSGKGELRIETASLMPADNVKGMRRDTLQLLKELDAPLYRWPGGNFVSGYDWRDGLGDRDRRPPRKNPAWRGVEHNDFGLDEFLVYCRELKTEPLIVVNTGAGQKEMALAELEYANGAASTPMGQLRAINGHSKPYAVKWWGIGNEMYGNWQIGHMPLEDYIKKQNEFVAAMRKQDSSIKVVAVGALGNWSEQMMTHSSDYMDLISEHFYVQEKNTLLAHVKQIPDNVRRKAEGHRAYRESIPGLAKKDIRISLDEWNYWYGPHVFGELGTRYFLKDALGIAAGVHEMARQSDMIFMANYAQTVNVIGCIKTSKTDAAFATTGLVLKMYRKHFGTLPVAVSGQPDPLDVAAAWTADKKTLTIGVVNPSKKKWTLPLTLKGVKLQGTGTLYEIAGDDPQLYNEPGQPPKVEIVKKSAALKNGALEIAPMSAGIYVFRVGK